MQYKVGHPILNWMVLYRFDIDMRYGGILRLGILTQSGTKMVYLDSIHYKFHTLRYKACSVEASLDPYFHTVESFCYHSQ